MTQTNFNSSWSGQSPLGELQHGKKTGSFYKVKNKEQGRDWPGSHNQQYLGWEDPELVWPTLTDCVSGQVAHSQRHENYLNLGLLMWQPRQEQLYILFFPQFTKAYNDFLFDILYRNIWIEKNWRWISRRTRWMKIHLQIWNFHFIKFSVI